MRILFLGDIVGKPGRRAVLDLLPRLRKELDLDLVIANGENASGGIGLTARTAAELLGGPIDALTSGNHIWKHKDLRAVFDHDQRLVRPANYPDGAPGRGWTTVRARGGETVAILNLLGRTFMEPVDCPFQSAASILQELPAEASVRIVDFHAEATSEKKAMGYFLDGKVTAVLGTHTHVQTNDARLLPRGTGFMTDIGMCGPYDSVLGMDPGIIVQRFTTGLPIRFEVAEGPVLLQGALLEVDAATGRAVSVAPWQAGPV